MIKWDQFRQAATMLLDRKKLPLIYNQRLNFELSEIEKQGTNQYWLNIVNERQKFATNPNGLMLPWLFGCVTDDPIKNNIEPVITTCRYANIMDYTRELGHLPLGIAQDDDKPDIDIDCLPDARDIIKAYAVEKYSAGIDDGYGSVCSVSTWMTYLLRSAIQDVAKATETLGDGWCTKSEAIDLTTGLPDEVDELKDGGRSICKGKIIVAETGTETDCKTVHDDAVCPKCGSEDTETPTLGRLLKEHPAFMMFYQKYPKVIDHAVQLVGCIRAMGKHAGALIIADRPLYGNVPMYRRATKDGEEIQWISMWTEGRSTQLSKFGYTKWDILGLKNLLFIQECCKMIKRNHNIDFGDNMEGWDDIDPIEGRGGHYIAPNGDKVIIDLHDPGALAVANKQLTDSIFQFDTPLATRTLGNQVRNFFDLMALAALGHPGPMEFIPEFVARRDDPSQGWRSEEHPLITKILEKTYSIIVYQEDLAALWQALAGFTVTEAQEARKAVAKKWRDKLKPVEQKWINGATKTLGEDLAKEMWQRMVSFGRYAFNQSHAVAYTLVAFRCLWLKAYFPHEWWSAVMSHCVIEKRIRYMNAARKEGIEFRTVVPSTLCALYEAVVKPKSRHDEPSCGYAVPGLLGIKGIGESARVFTTPSQAQSIDEFIAERGKQKTVFERLIKLGVFSELPGHHNAKANWVWYQYKYGSDTKLRNELNALYLKLNKWNDLLINQERQRQIDEFHSLYPKRKKIPKKITGWMPKPNITLEWISKHVKDFTLTEILKFEEEYLGYTIHSPLDQFETKGGRNIDQAKDIEELEAVIVSVYYTRTKTGRPMCRLTLTDGIQIAVMVLWEDALIGLDKSTLQKGAGIRVRVLYDDERQNFTLKRGATILRLRIK